MLLRAFAINSQNVDYIAQPIKAETEGLKMHIKIKKVGNNIRVNVLVEPILLMLYLPDIPWFWLTTLV
ncbi:hypothetical protein DJ324_17645 [Vibrio cholerae]|uniref:Uncharacterized protein n=1 Tax=Vibrio cholerae non-O1/non-O139 TaxID=156539 RepID=A0A220IT00_VIBCL|nr:hypothetical protein [Vibrio cholerae non-O1/non-O139]EGR2498540.1 hypothetical protein [Vibrio cholerae]EGR3628446.1 hypothetical protein [Vibrio cholerae]EGR3853245.1 hypothetical protein [Vibrio cholerae]EGR4110889.1 hypothetical protein [Vibrio cholerae]